MAEAAPAQTPEVETPTPNSTTRNNTNNRRRPNNRNSNLASMANAERGFKGKIEELPVVGKQYEQCETYDKLIKAVVDYTILNLEEGDDLVKLLEKNVTTFETASGLKEPSISAADEDSKAKMYIFQKEHEMYKKREHLFEKNKKRVYTILLGQCTPSLLTSVKSSAGWTTKNDEKDPLWVMKQIKKLSVGIDDYQNEIVSAHDAVARVYRMYQRPLETNDEYMDRFKEFWSIAESAAGEQVLIPWVVRSSDKYMNMSDEEWKEATKSIYFLMHADRIRFGDKLREIKENVVLGVDNYPITLDGAYRILSDTQSRLNQDRVRRGGTFGRRNYGQSNYQGRNNGPTIPEGANIVIGNDRRVYTIQCNRCNEWGHYATCCPETNENEQE